MDAQLQEYTNHFCRHFNAKGIGTNEQPEAFTMDDRKYPYKTIFLTPKKHTYQQKLVLYITKRPQDKCYFPEYGVFTFTLGEEGKDGKPLLFTSVSPGGLEVAMFTLVAPFADLAQKILYDT